MKTVKIEDNIYNLFLVEDFDELTQQKRWFIIKKNDLEKISRYYTNFIYLGNREGKIEDITLKGEVIAFHDHVNYKLVEDTFKLIINLMNLQDNIYDALEFLEDFLKKATQPNLMELQGIFAELFVIYKFNFLGDFYREYNYSKKDFFNNKENYYLEIKSTTSKNENVYKITKDQIDDSNTIFITVRLSREGEMTSLRDLYKKVKSNISEKSFIHNYFKNMDKNHWIDKVGFSLEHTNCSAFDLSFYKNSIIIKDTRIINYTLDFDFSGMNEIEIKNISEDFLKKYF